MYFYRYQVPVSLGTSKIFRICRDIANLPTAKEYELNFSETAHFEPFGMLMLASAIRRLRERVSSPDKVAIVGKDTSKSAHEYAHRLGFWWSIGCEDNIPSVKKEASETTIPIIRVSYKDMFDRSGGRDPIRAEAVDNAARDISDTLTGGASNSDLGRALEYSFREIIRNSFEHGLTDSVWYTAATRPTRDDVQVAVLDAGRGIRRSLADNPSHRHESDEAAIEDALRPGVSRNTGRLRSDEATQRLVEQFPGQPPSLYDNGGYGLTVTSRLGREAGVFTVVSGSSSISFVGETKRFATTSHDGTAVRLVLRPSKVKGAFERALDKAEREENGERPTGLTRPFVTASKLARLGFRVPPK